MELKKIMYFLLFLMTTTCLFAENNFVKTTETMKYKLFVDSIDYEYKNEKIIAHILLSDQSVWNFIVNLEDECLLFDLERDLTKGKEVMIYPEWHTLYFRIFPLNAIYNYRVSITKKTMENLPKLVKITRIEKPGNWFSSSTYTYEIFLSDNSIWKTNDVKNTLKCLDKWQEGHPILVGRDMQKQEWLLYNPSAGFDHIHDIVTSDYRSFRGGYPEGKIYLCQD